jgi:hypothetical protein
VEISLYLAPHSYITAVCIKAARTIFLSFYVDLYLDHFSLNSAIAYGRLTPRVDVGEEGRIILAVGRDILAPCRDSLPARFHPSEPRAVKREYSLHLLDAVYKRH